MSRVHRSLEEHLAVVRRLVAEYGGLPGPGWLTTHGYWGLYAAMRRHPDAFKSVACKRLEPETVRAPRTVARKRPAKAALWVGRNVALATQLAAEHDGVLPSPQWLIGHGHSHLDCVMRKNPGLFPGILRDRPDCTLDQHLAAAERLAEKYGKLPTALWLRNHGYPSLRQALFKYPEAFRHLL